MKWKVLVVDDDQALRTVLCDVLRAAGHDVVGSPDGVSGLQLCSRIKFDLVVCDVLMPLCDGVELIMALRHLGPLPAMIAISGGGHIDAEYYLKMATTLGVKAVLRKPFEMSAFVEAVRKVLTSQQVASA